MLEPQEKTDGMLCHLLSFVSLLGIPFGNIIGPLIFWSSKKDDSEFVDECGKESINFQISMTIYKAISIFLCFFFIGILFLPIVFIIDLVCTIKACIVANRGECYRYPMSITFVK